ADIMRDAAQLRTNYICKGCRGTGKVTERVKTGTRPAGGAVAPVYSDITEVCPTCKGKKLAPSAALPRLLEKTAGDLLAIGPEAKDADKALDLAFDTLRDIFVLSPEGLTDLVNPAAIQLLSGAPIGPGTPIVFVGKRDPGGTPGDKHQ